MNQSVIGQYRDVSDKQPASVGRIQAQTNAVRKELEETALEPCPFPETSQ